jgi:hypothetical protein
MTSYVAKYVAKKVFKETAANKHGQEVGSLPPLTTDHE